MRDAIIDGIVELMLKKYDKYKYETFYRHGIYYGTEDRANSATLNEMVDKDSVYVTSDDIGFTVSSKIMEGVPSEYIYHVSVGVDKENRVRIVTAKGPKFNIRTKDIALNNAVIRRVLEFALSSGLSSELMLKLMSRDI